MFINRVKFDYSKPDTWNTYQTKMKNGLFALSRESNPLKIDSTVDSWIASVKNSIKTGNMLQLSSMLSVIEYFYPQKIAASYFKDRIGYLLNTLLNLDIPADANVKRKQNNKKENVSPVTTKSIQKPERPKVSVKKNDSLDTEFPKFSGMGFPSCKTSLFEDMLASKKDLDTSKKDSSSNQ
jgi:hypothetical protein